MKRLALRTLAVLGVVLLLGAAVVSWLAATDSGLRFAWNQVEGFVPSNIRVGTLSGRLIGPIVATGIEVSTGSVHVALERAELDWRPLALLGSTVNVDTLSLRGLDITLIPSGDDDAADEPFELPQSLALPVDVNLEMATLDGLRFFAAEGASPLVVDTAALSLHFDDDELLFHELAVRAPLFDIDGRLNLTPRGDYASEMELDWALRPPGYPAASASTLVFGDARRLTVQQSIGAPYSVDAQAVVLQAFSEPALDGEVSMRISPAELALDLPIETIDASIAFEGGLESLAMTGRVDLTAPEFVDSRVDFAASYLGDAVAVESLRIQDTGSEAVLELAGRAELGEPELTVDLAGEWASLRWPLRGEPLFSSESGSLRLAGTVQDLVAELAADIGADGSIEGTVRRREEQLAVDLSWRNLGWPQAMPEVSSDSGALTVDGTLDAYRLTLDAALEVARGAAGHVRAAGSGTAAELNLEQIDIAVLDGSLTGSGAFAWDPAVAGSVSLTADNLDPGVLTENWPGRVGGRIEAAASTNADGLLSARLDSLTLDGELRDRAIALDASGSFASETIAIERFALRSGDSTVDASGTVGSDLDFEWAVESSNLEDLWPGFAGRLTASGNAVGPRTRPFVTLLADGGDLDLEAFDVSVADVSLAARVDAAGVADSNLELAVRELHLPGREVGELEVTGSGNAARHALTAAVVSEDADVRLALSGSVEEPWQPEFAWRFELESATLGYAALQPWTLRQPAMGTVTASSVELQEACWQSLQAELCAAAERAEQRSSARFTLAALPFQYFATLFPEGVQMTGTVDAVGELNVAPGEPPRLGVDITTSSGRIGSGAAGAAVAGLAFGSATANLGWDGESLVANLEWPFVQQQGGGLELHATVTQPEGTPFTRSAIEGSVLIEASNLGFVADLVDGVENTAGSVSGDIAVSGTIAAPRLVGTLELAEGTARLREPGIVLENVRMVLQGDGSGGIAVEGELTSGGGAMETEGSLSLDGSLPVGRIGASGEDFELFNTPDAQVFVSPDLRLELTPDRIELTGEVLVPTARLTPRGNTEGAIPVSADQVIVDAEEETASGLSRPFHARVELSLGEEVSFEGFGLTGNLGGALEIVEVPAEPTTGSGELRVEEGTYEAYGQELEIRTGRLLFAGGALSRPGIDIEAVRRPAEDVLVGARVRGTLDQPELSVFSEPPMPEQEQLSYLVLGRPLQGASASETSAVSQAAMALGLRGGNFVSERLNETLGFDEFGIQTQPGEATSAASFVIGKYLAPSLYVSYGVGLFEPVNTLRLRYTISSRWRLVTESSSAGSGGDLIYNIERGD